MRGNKYKISKKRRLRRRGKYSKKLKPKSRKSGGWPFLGHKKTKVRINATCDIPEFFFDRNIHEVFSKILVSTHTDPSEVKGKINISVYGDLVSKESKKADNRDDRTLSVKLSTAVIDKASFNNVLEVTPKTRLTIDLLLDEFAVTKNNSYHGYSSYTPSLDLSFTSKDTNDEIMKSLLHLWRKTYNPFSKKDPRFKPFDDFFKELSTHTDIVNRFRDHEYRFNVTEVILSSS
jgi:hypothetical protein